MLADVEALLDMADEQMAAVIEEYGHTLETGEFSPRLRALIKNVVENYRSSLDYVAVAAAREHGIVPRPKRGRIPDIYWPYADDPAEWERRFDRMFPGMADACPAFKDASRRAQPSHPKRRWLRLLYLLANENKHNLLTAQQGVRRRRVHSRAGAVVSDHTYDDWWFVHPPAPALGTLRSMQAGMRPMLQELCSSAGI